jgi:hypothetical protein
MSRLLVWIAPMLALGCSAEVVCNPNPAYCPVVVEIDAYWAKPPEELGPGEIVVEASIVSTEVVRTHSSSTEYASSIFGEHERACTLIRPVAVHVFHVRKVVRGVFPHTGFVMTEQPGGCGLDESSIRLGRLTPPVGDKPSYLVIRPTTTPPGVEKNIPFPSFGPKQDKPLPVMTWRDCSSKSPTDCDWLARPLSTATFGPR